jgi:hypothetical protein
MTGICSYKKNFLLSILTMELMYSNISFPIVFVLYFWVTLFRDVYNFPKSVLRIRDVSGFFSIPDLGSRIPDPTKNNPLIV